VPDRRQEVDLYHVSSAYLIPVLIAAIKLGMVPALVVAVGGVAASVFFFYPPIYDFRVADTEQLLDLPLFIIVAAVTSQLAARVRAHALRIEKGESEMCALYAFSKRLAIATDAAQIHAAIQDHLSSITGCPVIYFEEGEAQAAAQHEARPVSDAVLGAVREIAQSRGRGGVIWVDDQHTRTRWLVRAVSPDHPAFGLVAIDVGRQSAHGGPAMRQRIDAVLADATATLERLDVARAIAEAKLRAEAETLGAAVMGSVSHGLRTPLASIMGSASILVLAPAVMHDQRLSALASIVRDEAERLNSDIQRLLDASRISSTGVRPHMAPPPPADIVNAAVASQRRGLAAHTITVSVSDDLPLVQADPVLVEQALCQILDNAAKYSPPGSKIGVEAFGDAGAIVIAVRDEGSGLAGEEREQIFDRFYRGPRSRDTISGSGLGLWIARAFVVACGGRLEASSDGERRGTLVRIILPEAEMTAASPQGGADE
jgi:two-component system sensor histidine kinase KdpD